MVCLEWTAGSACPLSSMRKPVAPAALVSSVRALLVLLMVRRLSLGHTKAVVAQQGALADIVYYAGVTWEGVAVTVTAACL